MFFSIARDRDCHSGRLSHRSRTGFAPLSGFTPPASSAARFLSQHSFDSVHPVPPSPSQRNGSNVSGHQKYFSGNCTFVCTFFPMAPFFRESIPQAPLSQTADASLGCPGGQKGVTSRTPTALFPPPQGGGSPWQHRQTSSGRPRALLILVKITCPAAVFCPRLLLTGPWMPWGSAPDTERAGGIVSGGGKIRSGADQRRPAGHGPHRGRDAEPVHRPGGAAPTHTLHHWGHDPNAPGPDNTQKEDIHQ